MSTPLFQSYGCDPYQPKLDLANGTISGLEALIRWNDPESGLVPPAKFIPLLEETGMILEAGRWAMKKGVADYREWHTQGLQPPRIAVNVSPIQLRQKDFVDVVREAISGSGAGMHGLDLEITESLIMEDIDGNIEKLRAVRDMGGTSQSMTSGPVIRRCATLPSFRSMRSRSTVRSSSPWRTTPTA